VKLLEGYVENRTKEAALAGIMGTLFIIGRNFAIPIIPGVWNFTFSPITVYAAVAILSYPYTYLFPLLHLYRGSKPIGCIAYWVGTQTVFFLSKAVGKKRTPHILFMGDVTGYLAYGVLLDVTGVMDFWSFMIWLGPVFLLTLISIYFGGWIYWKAFKRAGLID